ncbi:MAG: hypothetical protein CMN75_10100 [Spirochaeta sp.]|nr:hypothetical protein [Spirochaeta sp.]
MFGDHNDCGGKIRSARMRARWFGEIHPGFGFRVFCSRIRGVVDDFFQFLLESLARVGFLY